MDNDYFTVVDNYLSDMKNELDSGQSGSAYLDSKDFATHVYYEYASIDVRQLYENMTKGIDMTDESNKARVKEMMVKAICCVVRDIACSAPSGGQNAFASYPDPVGVYITIRDCGTNRTADTCCIEEMNRYGGAEDEKFIAAMHEFVSNDFSGRQQYIKKLYAGKDADKITGAEHVNFSDALNMIGEIVNERF